MGSKGTDTRERKRTEWVELYLTEGQRKWGQQVNQADKAILRLLRQEVISTDNPAARAILLRLVRIVEAGAHISPDGKPL